MLIFYSVIHRQIRQKLCAFTNFQDRCLDLGGFFIDLLICNIRQMCCFFGMFNRHTDRVAVSIKVNIESEISLVSSIGLSENSTRAVSVSLKYLIFIVVLLLLKPSTFTLPVDIFTMANFNYPNHMIVVRN